MRNFQPNITLGWFPETGFINAWWSGYDEAMIMVILGLGSPTHPVPASAWNAWTSGYRWQTEYGYTYVIFPPLFGHQYSHCWIDFRNIQDDYMRNRGLTYFENYRTGRVWNRFMQNADIQRGLEKAGFKIITDVEMQPPSTPAGCRLFHNYPNPFNPTTTIRFSLQKREHVTLKVFNVLGQEVAALINGPMNTGEHKIVFDSRTLPSGVHIYQLEAGGSIQEKRMSIVKSI